MNIKKVNMTTQNQSFSQLVNQPTSQSNNQFKQPINGPNNQSIKQPIKQSANQPINSHFLRTSDAAEQTQSGRVPSKHVACPVIGRAFGDRDRHGDWLVKLPPPGLQGNDGAKSSFVTQNPLHQVYADWLGLGGSGQELGSRNNEL
jgi:hypothetical protein